MNLNIAIIDDDLDDRFLLERLLKKLNVDVSTYNSSVDFGERADPDGFDFVFIDYTINHGAGAHAILNALRQKSITKIVFISSAALHLQKQKDYANDPIVWGLLTKGDSENISNWINNRIWELKHPIEAQALS